MQGGERRMDMELLSAISDMMDQKISGIDRKISDMDQKISDMDQKISDMDQKFDEKLKNTENMILDELGRTRSILEDRIDRMQNNIDEMNQYYRITKLKNDNTVLILRLVDGLSKRVEALEIKTA